MNRSRDIISIAILVPSSIQDYSPMPHPATAQTPRGGTIDVLAICDLPFSWKIRTEDGDENDENS